VFVSVMVLHSVQLPGRPNDKVIIVGPIIRRDWDGSERGTRGKIARYAHVTCPTSPTRSEGGTGRRDPLLPGRGAFPLSVLPCS
jgi:hypothetical protein